MVTGHATKYHSKGEKTTVGMRLQAGLHSLAAGRPPALCVREKDGS